MPEASLVLITAPDVAVATTLARALVDEGLAACVSLLPGVVSIYRWQGAIEQASEVQLFAKTHPSRFDALAARVKTLHPYECPELLRFDAADGWPPYLRWIAESATAS